MDQPGQSNGGSELTRKFDVLVVSRFFKSLLEVALGAKEHELGQLDTHQISAKLSQFCSEANIPVLFIQKELSSSLSGEQIDAIMPC